MIKIRNQPAALRTIIRVGIGKVIADAVHETAYRAVDSLVGYYRHVLWSSAKSLHLLPFAKRFEKDHEFGKAIARVVCVVSLIIDATRLTKVPHCRKLNGRLSIYRGQVKRVAASKVEGYYQLLEGRDCVQRVKSLLQSSTYIYPTKQVSLTLRLHHFDASTPSLP